MNFKLVSDDLFWVEITVKISIHLKIREWQFSVARKSDERNSFRQGGISKRKTSLKRLNLNGITGHRSVWAASRLSGPVRIMLGAKLSIFRIQRNYDSIILLLKYLLTQFKTNVYHLTSLHNGVFIGPGSRSKGNAISIIGKHHELGCFFEFEYVMM